MTVRRSSARTSSVCRLVDGVGEACSAFVEGDQPSEGGEAREEPRRRIEGPEEIEVRDPAGHEDEVGIALSHDLVGDVGPVRRGRVTSRRRIAGRHHLVSRDGSVIEVDVARFAARPARGHGGGPPHAAIYRWDGASPWRRVTGPLDPMPYALATLPEGVVLAGLADGMLMR